MIELNGREKYEVLWYERSQLLPVYRLSGVKCPPLSLHSHFILMYTAPSHGIQITTTRRPSLAMCCWEMKSSLATSPHIYSLWLR
jgi:hypothetical protein